MQSDPQWGEEEGAAQWLIAHKGRVVFNVRFISFTPAAMQTCHTLFSYFCKSPRHSRCVSLKTSAAISFCLYCVFHFLPSPVIPLIEVYNKSLCKPRELLVEIIQEYPEEVEYIFLPSCVVLTRCAGCCNDERLQCMPTSSYNVTMEVRGVIYVCVYASAWNRVY